MRHERGVLAFSAWLIAMAMLGDRTSPASAGIPYAPFSTCTVSIVQNPTRSQCINNFNPDVVRLCPSLSTPVFDTMTFNLVVLDALAQPCSGVLVRAYETSGFVNIADGGSTTATTDAQGRASISVTRGSGCGRIGACADGVLLCEVVIRSGDVAWGPTPATCGLPSTGTSFVSTADITNPSCGFVAKIGVVTIGVNDCWDSDCSNVVNANDITGGIGKGGILQHYGHGRTLGARDACP